MRGFCWFIVAVLAVVSDAGAQQARIDRIDVLEYGLYRAAVTNKTASPGTATGTTNAISTVTFYETTTRVPARLGTRFGVRYRVIGAPDGATAGLRVIVRHPAPGLRNPQSGNVYRESVSDIQVRIGAELVRGYGLEADWEIVPGEWTIELWDGSRKLLARTFTLYKP